MALITTKDLTNEEEYKTWEHKISLQGCPCINVKIKDELYTLLIDTGAEISVISTLYAEEITKRIGKLPTLPLGAGLRVYSAVGYTKTNIHRRVLIPIETESKTLYAPFVVVPGLNEGGIIGNDFLEENGANIDYSERCLSVKMGNGGTMKWNFICTSKHGGPMHSRPNQTHFSKAPTTSKTLPLLPELNQIVDNERTAALCRASVDTSKPTDWKLVSADTLHRYIPTDTTMGQADLIRYFRSKLDPLGPPPQREHIRRDLPIWFMTNNQLRTTVFKVFRNKCGEPSRPSEDV